jgi:rfaE bifunctional protein kinase chain/domain
MIQVKHLQTLIERFRDTTILVVGDVMMDEYIWGSVSRVSPEAPVPVVELASESMRLGGAANVVHTLCSLGAKAKLCSVVGNDATGEKLRQYLQNIGVETKDLMTDPTRPTTLKTRIIAHHQQVVRLDREIREEISQELTAHFLDRIKEAFPSIDAVIIEDYGKGVITKELVQQIVLLATQVKKIIAVDPKIPNFSRYAGVSVITPNHHEAGAALQMTITNHDSLLRAGQQLLEELACELALITRGEEGMSLFERYTRIVTHVSAMAQEVYDVTGAGDTVIAAFTLGLAVGGKPVDAMLLANAAAGVVVGKVGTATVNTTELSEALSNMNRRHIHIRKEKLL